MALCKKHRLGDEFQIELIDSGLPVEQVEHYIAALSDAYTQSVATTPLITNKYFDLFTNGYCEAVSPYLFINSEVGVYLSKVYGTLHYSEEPRPNFLNVHFDGNNYWISEGLFYDRFPEKDYIGSIVPEPMNYKTEINHRGGQSPLGKAIAHFGYAIKYSSLSNQTLSNIHQTDFLDSPFDGNYKSEMHGECAQMFQVTLELQNYKIAGLPWKHVSILEEWIRSNKEDVEYLFRDNYSMCNANNEQSYLQRMVDGHFMARHFDSDVSGSDNYLYNAVTWITEGEFSGRELILGKRTPDDMISWIKNSLSATDNPEVYGKEPTDFKDTALITPESFKTILINSFNPIFYHGVNPMKGTGSVYTIINDFQPA